MTAHCQVASREAVERKLEAPRVVRLRIGGRIPMPTAPPGWMIAGHHHWNINEVLSG